MLASLQPNLHNFIVWENATHAHSTAVAAANVEIVVDLFYTAAVMLVGLVRLRHLIFDLRMSQDAVSNQHDGTLCDAHNNGPSDGIWSCERVAGQTWGKLPAFLTFPALCTCESLSTSFSSFND